MTAAAQKIEAGLRDARTDAQRRLADMLAGYVEPRRIYRAASRKDVQDLAFTVESVPDKRMAGVAAAIIEHDLMLGPWLFRLALAVMRWRGNPVGRLTAFYMRSSESARALLYDTARHIRDGKDTEDTTSVGGFSQREINTLVRILGVSPR